jgi:CheY-like chemotaxis protein
MTRILVADDDQTTRLLLSETLRAAKYTVVEAADGAAALKKLKTAKFDLALLDVWMPKMNGLQVLAALRKSKKRPKIIVMTSDDTPETLLGAIREQAYQYLAKPIEPKAMMSLVRETLQKKSEALPIEVISARPTWVELSVPCTLEMAERIEGFMAHLKGGLSEDVRRSMGQAFHELLLNAVERSACCCTALPIPARDSNLRSWSMRPSRMIPTIPPSTTRSGRRKGCGRAGSGCCSHKRMWTSCCTTKRKMKLCS